MRRRAGLRGALRPPTRARGGGGERPQVAVSPRPPQVTRCPPAPSLLLPRAQPPPRAHSPAWRAQDLTSSPRGAGNSGMERWPVTPVAPPGTGSVAEEPGEWRRRCTDECGAPGTVPAPRRLQAAAGVRAETAGLPGSPQRCDGASAAEGTWRGAVSTHPSGQGSGP